MRVGIIGWRGMVGSVLRERMREQGDWAFVEPTFFSTSNPGGMGPTIEGESSTLRDARDLDELERLPVLLSCQGGDYTRSVYADLRSRGWSGVWIDASSALRMESDTTLVLDPVNGDDLSAALGAGGRTFAGANCTVSLMLMGLVGLLRTGEVEWISSMTYQAASGAGAAQLRELVAQMRHVGMGAETVLEEPNASILDLDRAVAQALRQGLPTRALGAPLAASLIPWIDCAVDAGQTREEWKGAAEANKLLGRSSNPLPVDGLCVRVGSMRCHAQAFTIKLKSPVPVDEVVEHISGAHSWVEHVPNEASSTLERLTPAAVAGSLQVPVGRVRRLAMGPTYLTAFTVGDQLLWGAAEPLRRMLYILRKTPGPWNES